MVCGRGKEPGGVGEVGTTASVGLGSQAIAGAMLHLQGWLFIHYMQVLVAVWEEELSSLKE